MKYIISHQSINFQSKSQIFNKWSSKDISTVLSQSTIFINTRSYAHSVYGSTYPPIRFLRCLCQPPITHVITFYTLLPYSNDLLFDIFNTIMNQFLVA
jgi:hypothetical protein